MGVDELRALLTAARKGSPVRTLASSAFSNPGIDLFPDASCSLGSGDCEVFTFNTVDPDSTNPGPTVNRLRTRWRS